MDKAVLRSVLKDLVPGGTIKVHTRGSDGPRNFVVLSTRRGKGKFGSLLASLQLMDSEGATLAPIEIGTPRNQDIISITSGGEFFGSMTEREDPPTYEPNEPNAVRMKTSLRGLVGPAGEGRKVRLTSRVSDFNGAFTVTQGRLEKGKYGQVHLWLERDNPMDGENASVELWSYRHSGIIEDFEVVPD